MDGSNRQPEHDAAVQADSQLPLDENASLETVLAAWHAATLRLEKTHETLRGEVERLRAELEVKNRELARKNRLTDLGQMASHVAHEVRNNLVPVSLYMSLLRRRIAGDADGLEVLEKIESGIAALDVTVNDLLHFTSDREPRRESIRVRELIDDVFTSLAPQLAAQRIETTTTIDAELTAQVDRNMLRRAILNLVLNAIDAMPDGGQIEVCSRTAGGAFHVEVRDSGQGFADQVLSRAVEPFFTTKSTGTGLGLAIVDRVADAHGGCMHAENRPVGGAMVMIRIPQTISEAA